MYIQCGCATVNVLCVHAEVLTLDYNVTHPPKCHFSPFDSADMFVLLLSYFCDKALMSKPHLQVCKKQQIASGIKNMFMAITWLGLRS